jgi:hypothetical protein
MPVKNSHTGKPSAFFSLRLFHRNGSVSPFSRLMSSFMIRPIPYRKEEFETMTPQQLLTSPATSWGSHCRQGTGASMMTATADGGS